MTPELYERLLVAYRKQPGVHTVAAREAGCYYRTAKRAYEQGYKFPWAEPIKLRIRKEQDAARAELEELRRKANERIADEAAKRVHSALQPHIDREKAAADAIETRVEEAQMVRNARKTALGFSGTVARLVSGGNAIAQAVEEQLKANPKDFPVHDATIILGRISGIMRNWGECLRTALDLERLRLGDPNKAGEEAGDEMSLDDAVRGIVLAREAAERAIEQGLVAPEVAAPSTPKDEDPALS